MKPALLFLCHRIPYPPNKGDKIRSWNLLRYLTEHYDVYLGAFIDNPADAVYSDKLKNICADSFFPRLRPGISMMKSLTGLVSGKALTIPYYNHRKMHDWVKTTVSKYNIDRAVIFSSSMAQYLPCDKSQELTVIVDFVDVDSDKWRQYSRHKLWPLNRLYLREAIKLNDFEKAVTRDTDACLFVSSNEAQLYRSLASKEADKVDYFNNGVDAEYFSPHKCYQNPYFGATRALVFTGEMNYWPNVDAVIWFSSHVLPQLQAQLGADIQFYIVGRNPEPAVRKLAQRDDIVVTGEVEDVRPYLMYAHAAVAPMRISRGIQNKVLEAMAMTCPVITSELGAEGIDAEDCQAFAVARDVEDYVQYCKKFILEETERRDPCGRSHVLQHFSWQNSLPKVKKIIEDCHQNKRRIATLDRP